MVSAFAADRLTHKGLAGPFDLIIANILAGPLTRLARQIVAKLEPGGMLVLSGLLRNQEKMVISFYQGLRLRNIRRDGPWSALVLEKPHILTLRQAQGEDIFQVLMLSLSKHEDER